MSNVAIVEKGVVVYRGVLPKNWKNTSGLHNSKDDWSALAELGIYPLEEIMPSVNSATETLDGWTEDIQADKVVLTNMLLNLNKGDMVIFPSTLLHRVKPVTNKIRKSLVGWMLGPLTPSK